MSTNLPIEAPMDDDQVLIYTQHKRRAIVKELTQDKALPADPGQQKILLASLDGLDRAALGNKRIKADEKANANMAGAAGMIANLLNQMSSGKFQEREPDGIDGAYEAPALDPAIPDPSLVPGETDVNPGQLNYDTFVRSQTGSQP